MHVTCSRATLVGRFAKTSQSSFARSAIRQRPEATSALIQDREQRRSTLTNVVPDSSDGESFSEAIERDRSRTNRHDFARSDSDATLDTPPLSLPFQLFETSETNMNKDDLPPRSTPYYGKYQRDIFVEGATTGQLPNFSTDPDELEKKAKETVSKGGWLYSNSNAGVSWTHKANREAFYSRRLVPRMLVDTNQRDMSCELKLGNSTFKFDAPIGFAPIGINKIYHPQGELNSAKVARDLNLAYCLSTAGSQSIPDVAKANGNGTRFFQLYWPPDDKLTIDILKQAVENGYEACFLTLDTWQLAWRHGDISAANYAFYRGIGYELGKALPVFQDMCKERGIELDSPEAGQFWIDQVWHGKAKSWEQLPWVIKTWKELSGGKPFVLKGIQSVADAQRAAETPGVDGIVVSNHAGRQVDGAIGSLDALDAIIQAGVGEKITVMFDSGIREAADVAKALALGAKMVFVGRLFVYAMSIGGEPAVRHVMTSLLANLDILMNVGGFRTLKDFDRSCLVTVPHASLTPTKL